MIDPQLLSTIRRVRREWRVALLLRGAAITIAAILALLALSAIGFARFGFGPATLLTARILVGASALIVLVISCLRPLLERVSDARVALYIEERAPELQSLLISAVESGEAHTVFQRGLIDRAATECRRLNYGRYLEQERLRRNGAIFATVLAIVVIALAAGPPSLRRASSALLRTPAEQPVAVMSIALVPGNDTIARGANFSITARLHGFENDAASVVTRDEAGVVRRAAMGEAQAKGAFEAVLPNVQASADYYVESGTVRSPLYHVTVVDAPYVKGLTIEYVYPAYTGMQPQRIDNAGDITAPRGTTVRISASTSVPVNEGRLQMNGTSSVPLRPAGGDAITTSLRVMHDGFYHIELPDIDGRFTTASAQYAITAIVDQPPRVTVDKPGRDIKVTAVDEVFVGARAEDDYGVAQLDLVYSVNGGAQQTVSLATPKDHQRVADGAYTFLLEDLTLKPGDIVSYFVRAADNNAIDGARTATSDIFFIQIRPFSRNYKAAEQAGQQASGQQEDDPTALSERERQIIAATFNVTRDSATYNKAAYEQAINTIELSQERLREQVTTLVQRMQQRGVAQMDSMFAQIAQLLPQAAREMTAAEGELHRRAPKDAIAPEQRALQQLTRAEALYRDVQVQMMQQQQQPGGGSGNALPEDLADLFELERDKLGKQYETVQRPQEQQAQRNIDEALQRLRELAQRQQSNQGSGAQRRLADETEQAARQLERLARENRSQAMQEAAQSLQEAANAMRQSSSGTAQQRLEEARRRLQQNEQRGMQERIGEARRRAEELRDQPDASQRNLGAMELQGKLDRLAPEARRTSPAAGRALDSAAATLRSTRDLGRTAQQLRNAEEAAGTQSPGARAQAGAEQARRIAEGVEGMRERARGQGQRGTGGQANSRQLRAEANARAGEMRELQRQLQQNGMPAGAVGDAIDAMNAAAAGLARGDSKQIEEQLARAARAVEEAEFDLNRLAQGDRAQRLFTQGRPSVPAQYRKAVENYYRALSRGRK